jgi:hypothetical protein
MDPLEQKQKEILEKVNSMLLANADGLFGLLGIVTLQSSKANPLNNPYYLRMVALTNAINSLSETRTYLNEIINTF